MFARREFVATIASIAGTAFPFALGPDDAASDDAGRQDATDDAGTERRDGISATVATGVVDRIEDGVGVVLIERAREVVAQQLVSVDRLPPSAREEGAVLSVTLADGDIRRLRHLPAATERRRADAEDRLDALADDLPP